jgi:hypothetical protein
MTFKRFPAAIIIQLGCSVLPCGGRRDRGHWISSTNSQHLAHARSDPARYWSLVSKTWDSRNIIGSSDPHKLSVYKNKSEIVAMEDCHIFASRLFRA